MIAALLLAMGAIDGVTLLVRRLQGSNPNVLFAVLHGVLVVAGAVTLAVAVARGERGLAVASLAVFGVAALGGLVLATIHASGRLIPVTFVLAHGALASVGFLLLVLHILGVMAG
jgi:hypothetical protein